MNKEGDVPKYTCEDMKVLEKVSEPGSVSAEFPSEFDYDPEQFRQFLIEKNLKEELHYLFELPFDEVVLLIDSKPKMGYLKFRAEVGK